MRSAEKRRWQGVAEEGILDYFRHHADEPFHSDVLDSLVPTEHRRSISNAVMSCVNKGWIVKCGERASKIPSRNSAKSGEYRLTEAGAAEVRKLAPAAPVPMSSSSAFSPANEWA